MDDTLKEEIKNYNIKTFVEDNYEIDSKISCSDIFEFIWETNNIKYMRKS